MSSRVLQTVDDKMKSLRESFNSELRDLRRLCIYYGMSDDITPISLDFACLADRVEVSCYECVTV